MHGFLCINKSPNVTSRDSVNAIQRLVRPCKVGHAGTLVPMATGVLVVAIGCATRLIQFVQQMPKTYLGTFELGKTSDTEDITGQVVARVVDLPPTLEEVTQATQPLVGRIMQQPPVYSALKVKGERAYSLSRQGKHVALEPRPVFIHEIEIVRYEFPILQLRIVCGSGTYVRSIGRDIGEALGCGAVMSGLVRTAIGSFLLDESFRAEDVTTATQMESRLRPLGQAVSHLPRVVVDSRQIKALSFGQKLPLDASDNQLAAFDEHQTLVAVLTRSDDSYRPSINFAAR